MTRSCLTARARNLPIGALLLVQRSHIRNDEASGAERFLYRPPNSVRRIAEDNRHPAAGLQNACIFVKARAHQSLIVENTLVFRADRRLLLVAESVRTRCQDFNKVVEIGVVDILTKWRIGENIVDR